MTKYVLVQRKDWLGSSLFLERGFFAGSSLGETGLAGRTPLINPLKQHVRVHLQEKVIELGLLHGEPIRSTGDATRLPDQIGHELRKVLQTDRRIETLENKLLAWGPFATDREVLEAEIQKAKSALREQLTALRSTAAE